MEKLILFDIDRTLVASSTGHIEAFAVAFREVYGIYGSRDAIDHHGKTDQQIIEEVLLNRDVPLSEIRNKMGKCLQVMTEYFAAIKGTIEVAVFPGVTETLISLDTESHLLGLATGNLAPIARGKLEQAGIGAHFKVGGYGSDARERRDIVRTAVQRAKEVFRFTLDNNAYLFGDAPYDMSAAAANGLRPIGVTTGRYAPEELSRAGAFQVIAGVGNQGEVINALLAA